MESLRVNESDILKPLVKRHKTDGTQWQPRIFSSRPFTLPLFVLQPFAWGIASSDIIKLKSADFGKSY